VSLTSSKSRFYNVLKDVNVNLMDVNIDST